MDRRASILVCRHPDGTLCAQEVRDYREALETARGLSAACGADRAGELSWYVVRSTLREAS